MRLSFKQLPCYVVDIRELLCGDAYANAVHGCCNEDGLAIFTPWLSVLQDIHDNFAMTFPYWVINTSSVAASKRYLLRFFFNSVAVIDTLITSLLTVFSTAKSYKCFKRIVRWIDTGIKLKPCQAPLRE